MRHVLRSVYQHAFPIMQYFFLNKKEKRLIEKTASNCFRLGYVNEVFPDAKIIYPVRDGRNNVNSLINGWLHPSRFFTYDVPETLRIKDYPHGRWKFVLPPGWRDYINRSLAEVCAFQWRSCHEAMLTETNKPKYQGRIFRVRLEELITRPDYILRGIAKFIEVPYDEYFASAVKKLPIVNSPDNDTSEDKWRYQNPVMINQILPAITPVMRQLGYEV